MSDPTIERIEAELRESRTQAWDVETFLANRHRAKIEALTKPADKWTRRWQAAKEVAFGLAAYFGTATLATLGGYWLLTGHLPQIERHYDVSGLPLPPFAPPAHRVP